MRLIPRLPVQRLILVAVVVLVGPSTALGQADVQTLARLQTPAEGSGFSEYTSYTEMMDYLQAVQAASTEMRLAIYGTSYEGRELPLAIFSRPSIRRPWEALVSGKPIVVLAANVHGGERTLRESALILIREFATPGSEMNRLLDDVVLLIAPSVNPDGLMASPRPTRGNAWGIDLNRDYVKLEQQSLANYVANVVNTWHPHVLVDGHNGGSYPYNICYQCPTHASADPAIVHLCDREIFPYINSRMEENGFQSFYYSGASRNNPGVWTTGGSDPRIARNYLGFSNSIGILFESPGGQEREVGIRSGMVAYTAVVQYAQQNPGRVMDTVSRARWETVEMGDGAAGEVTVQQVYGPEDFSVTYQTTVGPRESRELITVTSDSLMKKPVPTKQRQRPYAYLLPRQAVAAVALLRRHGITIEVLQDTLTIEVEAYRLKSVEYLREYDHNAAVRVEIDSVLTLTQRFPRGTYVIPTGQVMGRVVAHMLEPETNDNVVRWNTMDAWLPLAPPSRRFRGRPGGEPRQPPPPLIPIYKVMKPTPMPTRIKY